MTQGKNNYLTEEASINTSQHQKGKRPTTCWTQLSFTAYSPTFTTAVI